MDYGKHMEKRMEARVKKGVTKGFKIFAMIILATLFFLLAGYVLQLLWNWLMPELFELPMITYWQAFGLLILAKIFFGFGNHNSNGKKDHTRKQRMIARQQHGKTRETEDDDTSADR